MTITEHWHDLVTTALLGTDRRDPPPPPDVLAAVVDDALGDTASARMLDAVAATVVARRAGVRPGPPATPLQAAPPDPRPLLPPVAARRWWQLVGAWPVLEDEWWLTATRRGWRPSPDVLVGALRRHRRDARRWGDVMVAGGPGALWLVDQRPELGRRDPTPPPVVDLGLDGLPALPVPAELVDRLTASASVLVPGVTGLLAAGAITPADRNVFVNLVARCRRDVLTALATALRTEVDEPATTLALTLADLATTRHTMLVELEP